jgi:hypothetical protein
VRGGKKESDAKPGYDPHNSNHYTNDDGNKSVVLNSAVSQQHHASLHGPLSIENDIRTFEMNQANNQRRSKSLDKVTRTENSITMNESNNNNKDENDEDDNDEDLNFKSYKKRNTHSAVPPSDHRGAAFGAYLSGDEYSDVEGLMSSSSPRLFHDDIKEKEEKSFSNVLSKSLTSSSSSSSSSTSTSSGFSLSSGFDIKSLWPHTKTTSEPRLSKLSDENAAAQVIAPIAEAYAVTPSIVANVSSSSEGVLKSTNEVSDGGGLTPLAVPLPDNSSSSFVPPTRVTYTPPTGSHTKSNNEKGQSTNASSSPIITHVDALTVNLVVPGRILHMYKRMGATIPAVVPPPTIPYQIPPCLRGVDPHVAMVDDHYLQQYIQQIRNCRSTIEAGLCFISEDDEVAVEQLMSHPRIKVKPWKPFASASVCEVNDSFWCFFHVCCVLFHACNM